MDGCSSQFTAGTQGQASLRAHGPLFAPGGPWPPGVQPHCSGHRGDQPPGVLTVLPQKTEIKLTENKLFPSLEGRRESRLQPWFPKT